MTLQDRAYEIATFLGIPEQQAIDRLSKGFLYQHAQVTADFRRANPKTDQELLDWYRNTEEYIWELSAYHADPGFNYEGTCKGIVERLRNEGVVSVLVLGDGIGDLTLALGIAGMDATYHDLMGSKTFSFARMRLSHCDALPDVHCLMCPPAWDAALPTHWGYDAICSLDFLEHVPNVEEWVRAIYTALKPGGLFVAQNAFGLGSGPDGSMPMHLPCNDRYIAEWDPMLTRIGFEQLSPQWYRRAA